MNATTSGVADLLGDAGKGMVNKLFQVVRSYDMFNRYTCFSNVLHNTLSNQNTTYSNINDFLSQLKANGDGQQDLQALKDTAARISDLAAPTAVNSVLANQLYNSDTSFVDRVIELYKVAFSAIGPSTTDSIPSEYVDSVRAVCAHVYFVVYQQLAAQLKDTDSAFVASFPHMSLTTLDNRCSSLCSGIVDSVTLNPNTDSVDDYVNRCYLAVYNPSVNTSLNASANSVNCELFALCFLPFFAITYLTGFIATPVVSATNKAPRDALIRRIAIMCVYEFQLYLLYTVYLLSANYSPASRQTYELRMILDMSITQVYDDEASHLQTSGSLKDMHDKTRTTFEKNDGLAALSQQIEASRASYTSVKANEQDLDAQVRRAKVWLYVWTALLLTYVLSLAGSLFASSNSGAAQGTFLLGVGLTLAVVITALVRVLRVSSSL